MADLETARREAENWAKYMMRSRESANKLALSNVEATLPAPEESETIILNSTPEDLAYRRTTRFWNGAICECLKISNLNQALTTIQESKGKLEALYKSLTAKRKSRKEMLTGQKRSISGLAKEKVTAERAFKSDMEEHQLKLTELNEKLDLVGKDIDLAKANSEAAELITLGNKKKALIKRKLAVERAVKKSEDTFRVDMAKYEVTTRRSERVSTKKKTTYEKIEDDTLTAEEALSFLNAAEVSCKDTISLSQTRFLDIIKKVNNVRMPISRLSDMGVLSLLVRLPTHVLEDRLEGFKMNFYLQDVTEALYDAMSAEIEFICKGTIKVVHNLECSLEIRQGRCTFLEV